MRAAREVAVVGAGITGLAIAWHLRRHGIAPLVLERRVVGAGASGVQPGGVRTQWGTRVNCLLARESLAFYREAEQRLGTELELGFRACGYLFLAHTDAVLERLGESVAVQHAVGIPSRIVSAEEAAELVPGLRADSVAGASWCAEDGYFDRPQSVVEAFAAGAEIELEEVVGLRERRGGWALELRGAEPVRAEQVVVAAGVETPALVEAPIEPEDRYLFLSDPIRERLLEPLVIAPERSFAAKQLGNGRVLASDLGAAGDPEAEAARWRMTIRDRIRELLPILEYVSFPVLVHGVYDVTPDRQAILGRVPGRDGVWMAAGFSGHGFMLAPAVGRMLAEAIIGAGEDEALRVLAPGRFAESALVPEPQVI